MKESIQTNVENVQSSQVKKFFHPNYEAYCIFSICLRPQYLLSIDHSLPLSHQFCPLIIREHALNFYTLQAITMPDCVLLFDHQSHDTSTFLDSLLPLHPPQAQVKFGSEPPGNWLEHFDYTRHEGCQSLLEELDVREKSGLDHLKLVGMEEMGRRDSREGGDAMTLVIKKQTRQYKEWQ
ncbi:hypothetical protein HPP92_026482 [Vanilla planifolia]|uniref:Uncharacterized protein n=1 Tax=Vanilla planifolia TaxID=51239 RepID=A0A835U9Q7_VANPL|nr:hypothetical protein HPP92_026482 [Vanilla planifolia]